MKYLIVGLGNPGLEYSGNRHNVGFMVLDEMVQSKEKTFSSDRLGYTCTLRHKGRQLVLLKPTTFMNLSGKSVRFHLNANKLEVEQLLVISDDIALPYGKLRMKGKGSAGGHNGLGNIEEVLGTREYARLRFGVGDNFSKGRQADYVLSDFSPEEDAELPPLLKKAGEMIVSFVTQGISRTMTAYNR